MQLEIVICQAGDPAMTGCIQLGYHKHVCEGVVVGVHIKGQPIQVLVEFLDHCPLQGEKLQLVCCVMGFSLAQVLTGIGYHSICAVLVGLVEDNSQTRTAGISVKLEKFGEICICESRCCGT